MSSFSEIYDRLSSYPAPLLPPGHARAPALTPKIADLQLHPTLEAGLHLLNEDLPSAHFLARHMQSAPAFEGMYLHGILHRIEGDYDNARAWYEDVAEADVFQAVWQEGGKAKALQFIDDIQSFKERTSGKQGTSEDGADGKERSRLEQCSRKELDTLMQHCRKKFGTERMLDASGAWVEASEKIKSQGQDQVSGDAGARTF